MFYPLKDVDKQHEQSMEILKTKSVYKSAQIVIQVRFSQERWTQLTPHHISVASIGMPRGPHANRDHILELHIETFEGPKINIGFQSSLPDLLGRVIYFKLNNGNSVGNYQEPAHVWFGPNSDRFEVSRENIANFGRPVKSGTMKVEDFNVDPEDGLLTGLNAEFAFETDEFFIEGKSVQAPGIVKIHLPEGSLLPPYTLLEEQDIRVSRPGYENWDQRKEAGSKKPRGGFFDCEGQF